jgi:hypothetical protein
LRVNPPAILIEGGLESARQARWVSSVTRVAAGARVAGGRSRKPWGYSPKVDLDAPRIPSRCYRSAGKAAAAGYRSSFHRQRIVLFLLVVKHLVEAPHIDRLPAVLARVEMLGFVLRLRAISGDRECSDRLRGSISTA